ncbi:MAG: addiction module protein [Candidatus Auribacterota bacterium]|nr:addiction module protein [Candidatus Auribacterota bacterium]
MIANLCALPIVERIQIVEDIWDSIAADQRAIPITDEQRNELDRRLDAYDADGIKGRIASEAIEDIRDLL